MSFFLHQEVCRAFRGVRLGVESDAQVVLRRRAPLSRAVNTQIANRVVVALPSVPLLRESCHVLFADRQSLRLPSLLPREMSILQSRIVLCDDLFWELGSPLWWFVFCANRQVLSFTSPSTWELLYAHGRVASFDRYHTGLALP
jgi:hypothetical protein